MSCFGWKQDWVGIKKPHDAEILCTGQETKSRHHDLHPHRRRPSPAVAVSARRSGDISESTTASASSPQGSSRVLPGAESYPGITSTSSSNNSNNNVDDTRSSASREQNSASSLESTRSASCKELREFKYAELKSATSNFHPRNVLGEGGFGFVYKGVIMTQKLPPKSSSAAAADGSDHQKLEVAIKVLKKDSQQGHKEWLAEVHFLGLVDNPFLVKLIGYCAEDGPTMSHRLLVYEYMPNRGLDNHLFRGAPPILPWQTRVKIALGAARGLAYLHEEMDIQVIFRDFKTSNVLLDDEFHPKLTDFGLARQGPDMDATHVTTVVKGTIGYAAPEYIQTGHLTSKSDVWSFGVVMFEILTGRKAQDRNRPRSERKLIDWVKPFIHEVRSIHHIMDPQLDGKYPEKAAFKFASIAAQCLVQSTKARPKMSDVVQGLDKVLEMTFLWEMPITTPPRSPVKGTTRVSRTNRTPRRQHTVSDADPPVTSRLAAKPSIRTPISPSHANPPITSRHDAKPSIQTPISPLRITTQPVTSLPYHNPNSTSPSDHASSKKTKKQQTSAAGGTAKIIQQIKKKTQILCLATKDAMVHMIRALIPSKTFTLKTFTLKE